MLPSPLPVVPPNALAALSEPLATAACVVVALATSLVCGVPLLCLLRRRRALTAEDWLLAPFVGLGALVLLLQNLVYLGVPVARSTPFVWLLALALGAVCLRSAGARASWRAFPRALAALALAAYLAQGLALLQVGARHWMGRLWEDQFSYTGMAEFLAHEPFGLDVEQVAQRPWLFRVLRPSLGRFYLPFGLKENRIGQSLLQAFLAASVGGDAKTLFGPTILLGAPLLVCGVGLLARRLGLASGAVAAAAWLAALAPGFTLLHLESFLSHALVLAFLPAWLIVLDDLGRAPGADTLAVAALVLSFAVATYGELWLALLALAAVSLGLSAWQARAPARGLLLFALLVAAPLVLNPGFTRMLLLTTVMGSSPAMHTAIYPWAYTLEGAGRLWWGDLVAADAPWQQALLGAMGLALSLAGLGGLGLLALRRSTTASLALRVSLTCLALGPLPFLVAGRHPYQFYKLVQTALPALVVGLLALLSAGRAARLRRAGALLAGLVLVAASLASLDMVRRTATLAPQPRSNAGLFLAPEARALQARLESLRGASLIVGRGLYPLQNAWITWFARHNAVWLAEPFLGRDRLERSPGAAELLALERAPFEALLLTRRDDRSFVRPPADVRWANGAWELWQPRNGAWVTLFDIDRPGAKLVRLNVARTPFGERLTLGRGALRLRLLAGQAGRARVTLEARARRDAVALRAPGCAPAEALLHTTPSLIALSCDVRQGFDEVRLQAFEGDRPARTEALDLSLGDVAFAAR